MAHLDSGSVELDVFIEVKEVLFSAIAKVN
jgi:hypothetical protein